MSWPPRCVCGHVPEEHGLVLDVGCHVGECGCEEYEESDEAVTA